MKYVLRDQTVKIYQNCFSGNGGDAKLDFVLPIHMIDGPSVSKYGPPEFPNVIEAVKAGLEEVKKRQGSKGITIITRFYYQDVTADVVEAVTEVGREDPLVYIINDVAARVGMTNTSEEEMKLWLKDKGNRDLVTDIYHVRGYEDSTVMVIDDGMGVDSICMRAVSHLIVVNKNQKYE